MKQVWERSKMKYVLSKVLSLSFNIQFLGRTLPWYRASSPPSANRTPSNFFMAAAVTGILPGLETTSAP